MQKASGRAYLLKGDAEVDVYDLPILRIQEDVRNMSIAKPEKMSDNGRRRHAARVVQARPEPRHGRFVLLGKVVPHDRVKSLAKLDERFAQVLRILALFPLLSHDVGKLIRLDVIRPVSASHPQVSMCERRRGTGDLPDVSRAEPGAYRSGVTDKLQQAGLRKQRYDLVTSDCQIASTRLAVPP